MAEVRSLRSDFLLQSSDFNPYQPVAKVRPRSSTPSSPDFVIAVSAQGGQPVTRRIRRETAFPEFIGNRECTGAGETKKAAPFGATLFKEAKWRESEEN